MINGREQVSKFLSLPLSFSTYKISLEKGQQICGLYALETGDISLSSTAGWATCKVGKTTQGAGGLFIQEVGIQCSARLQYQFME